MHNESEIRDYFKILYNQPINVALPNSESIHAFNEAAEYIGKFGQPKDAIELLMLVDIDKSKPVLTHLNKLAEVISFLMTKPSVRKEWSTLEKSYHYYLMQYAKIRVDESLHYPKFDVCCAMGCCDHDYYSGNAYEKICLLSTEIIPLLKDNFPPQITAHLLGIASFDPDEHIRNEALQQMAYLATDETLPYLLLRLNDPEVTTLAQRILKKIFEENDVSIKQIKWCLPLIEQLNKEQRVDLKTLFNTQSLNSR